MRARTIGILVAALALAACGEDQPAGGATELSIAAYDFRFEPASLQAPTGSDITVELTNEGETEHSFTIDAVDANVEAGPGESATVGFLFPEEARTLEWYCRFHPDQMTGTITTAGAEASPAGGGGGGDETRDDIDY